MSILHDHPIFRQFYEKDVLERLLCKLLPDKLARHAEQDMFSVLPLIAQWQQRGTIKKVNPELIVSAIRSLMLLTLQRELIGEEWYEETMALFIDWIADGLVVEK